MVEEWLIERQARLLDVEDPPAPRRGEAARAAAWLVGYHRALARLEVAEWVEAWRGHEELAQAYREGHEAGQVLRAAGATVASPPAPLLNGEGSTATAALNGEMSTATVAEWAPPRGWREHDNG